MSNGHKATGASQQDHFRMETFTDGVMPQLSQRSIDRDV
jgi:hypothetical protein